MLSEVYTLVRAKSTALIKGLIVVLALLSMLVSELAIEVNVTEQRFSIRLETNHK